jgi:hypothetical protein
MADIGALLGSAGIGGAIGQAVVRLELETAKYNAELKAAQAQTTAGTNAMAAETSKFSGAWLAAAGIAGAAVVAFAADTIASASRLTESLSKTQVVFGENADAVVSWSQTSAEAMGISQQAALEAASTFANLFATMDVGEQASVNMSENLVRLASDLASFNNVDPSQVLENLRSGLVGEIEPLRKFGINITAAAVEQEALNSGLWDGKGAIDANARVLATYNLIMEQTTTAQGDFARTSDELANSQRILNAEWENTKARFGENLQPVAQEGLSVLNEVLEGVNTQLLHASTASDQFAIAARNAGYEVEFMAETTVRLTDGTVQYVGSAREAILWVNRQILLSEKYATQQAALVAQIEASTAATDDARRSVVRFAGMTGDKLQEWKKDVKQSFDSFVLNLEETTEATKVTSREFIQGSRDMLERARDLDHALRDISKEKWVNDEYLEFLADLGPENLIGFANLNETQQRRMQRLWTETTEHTDAANRSLNHITNTLRDIDNGTSTHKVRIEYEYVGFDPTKPGMGDRTGRGGPQ